MNDNTTETKDGGALAGKLSSVEDNLLRIFDELKKAKSVDQRWLAVGRTHIEEGFMAARRSVFPPRAYYPETQNGIKPADLFT